MSENKFMTLEEYIINPMGKSNAVLSLAVRETIKKQYSIKFHNVLLRENGKIDYYTYKDAVNNTFYIHVKVPSETVPNFYYDVVFKFFADENIKETGRNLEKYYVKFFSNDPAFVYTYAHTFMKNGLFIDELRPKMVKDAIKKEAKEKNPQNINNYSKILYFGYLFLKERGLLKRAAIEASAQFNLKQLLNNIAPADIKIADRQDQGNKISKKKKIKVDNKTLKKMERIGLSDQSRERLVTTTSRVTNVKKTSAINSTKSIKTTKRK